MTEGTPAARTTARKDSGALLAILLVLTTFSGVLDAVSYLGLGHVFTANMTGNVVILGFAAAGAKDFSVSACLTSLAAFLSGALSAGRASRLLPARRLLLLAVVTEFLVTAVAAVVALSVDTVSAGWPRFTVIALLAFGMGVRNATVRHIGVRDLPTTVLTMTLTGIAADSSPAGGDNAMARRRGAAVIAMLGGAFVGAVSFLHLGAGPTLLWDSGCVLAAAVALAATSTLKEQAKS
jgi:uncharacterized membrane protein YoaK (UPF0700 family)